MSLDGLTLAAATAQLTQLTGCKVSKITQPAPDELILYVRGSKNAGILLCASPENCRVHETYRKRDNPAEPPMFCMLLRKRLSGARITQIEQVNYDRIVRIAFETHNELYERAVCFLYAEVMGRHSNIILTDENGIIIDAAKRVGLSVSSARHIIPGQQYVKPPTEEKADPRYASEADFLMAIESGGQISKALSRMFYGLAPQIAFDLVESLGLNKTHTDMTELAERKLLASRLFEFYAKAARGEMEACFILDDNGNVVSLRPFVPALPEKYLRRVDNIGAALDEMYAKKDFESAMRRKTQGLGNALKTAVSRHERKLALYDEAIADEGNFDTYRQYGEAVTSNIYRIRKGECNILADVYEADGNLRRVEIPLDTTLTPSQNAQKYFKRYQKAKAARDMALSLRDKVAAELEYLNEQLESIRRADSVSEADEIREELISLGFLRSSARKTNTKQRKQKKPTENAWLRVESAEGFTILVGKNSRQNDLLTFKHAKANDIWLHVKGMHGSHVIIVFENREITLKAIAQAAGLAAYYSEARMGSNVPVDYTLKRNVRRHPLGLPGMASYTGQKTIYVEPSQKFEAN